MLGAWPLAPPIRSQYHRFAKGAWQFRPPSRAWSAASWRIANQAHGCTESHGPASFHRFWIIPLPARHKLPAFYFDRSLASAGGLVSYGPDFVDQFRGGAGYVDRILKGEKPGDLPVQAPTKYELVLNLKTAKAL